MSKLDDISDWPQRAERAEWQLSLLAAACGVSVRQLRRYIEKGFRVAPHVWLMKLRLGKAAQLLRRPGARIKEIASQLHFASADHFSRVFTKHYGLSPTSFRRKVDSYVGNTDDV